MLVHDELTGQLRLLAPGRAKRLGPRPEGCPFCLGNEEATPPEIDRVVPDGADAWSARAVPNLFPLAERHEVLILSSSHKTSTRELSLDEWGAAITLWQRRLDVGVGADEYAHLFVNDGRGAGASLEHVHAQLVVVPRAAGGAALVDACVDQSACAACRLAADDELQIASTERLVLRAHPSPRTNEGLLLIPRDHVTRLDEVPVEELAQLLTQAMRALPEADFNCWLASDGARGAHWYVEFAPRTSTPAGVELGLGIGVAIVSPEDSAVRARERLGVATAAR